MNTRFFGAVGLKPMEQPAEPTPKPVAPKVEAQPLTTQTKSNGDDSGAANVKSGKGGTVTPDEFKSLEAMVNKYGPEIVALKIAKICKKKSEDIKHEYAKSRIAAGYDEIATAIENAVA